MDKFLTEIQIRWADLDPNIHLRHSVYYDWGALSRIEFFYHAGLTADLMKELNFGPILFREECLFRKEMRLGDKASISLLLVKSKRDFSRWTIRHEIYKNGDTVSAILTVDGAWIDTVKRKLAIPGDKAIEVFSEMPKDPAFQWVD